MCLKLTYKYLCILINDNECGKKMTSAFYFKFQVLVKV